MASHIARKRLLPSSESQFIDLFFHNESKFPTIEWFELPNIFPQDIEDDWNT